MITHKGHEIREMIRHLRGSELLNITMCRDQFAKYAYRSNDVKSLRMVQSSSSSHFTSLDKFKRKNDFGDC